MNQIQTLKRNEIRFHMVVCFIITSNPAYFRAKDRSIRPRVPDKIDHPFMWYQNIGIMFILFVTKHACVRRTERQNYDPNTALA